MIAQLCKDTEEHWVMERYFRKLMENRIKRYVDWKQTFKLHEYVFHNTYFPWKFWRLIHVHELYFWHQNNLILVPCSRKMFRIVSPTLHSFTFLSCENRQQSSRSWTQAWSRTQLRHPEMGCTYAKCHTNHYVKCSLFAHTVEQAFILDVSCWKKCRILYYSYYATKMISCCLIWKLR